LQWQVREEIATGATHIRWHRLLQHAAEENAPSAMHRDPPNAIRRIPGQTTVMARSGRAPMVPNSFQHHGPATTGSSRIIDADGTSLSRLRAEIAGRRLADSVAWLPDSQSFYAQNLDALYHFALDGTVQEKRSLATFIPRASFNSEARHVFHGERRAHAAARRRHGREHHAQVWTAAARHLDLDFATGKATRLTPKGHFAWDPVWVSEDEILCAVQPEKKSREPSIIVSRPMAKSANWWSRTPAIPTVSR